MAGSLKRVWLIERTHEQRLWEPAGFNANMTKREAVAEVARLNAKPRVQGEVWWKYQVAEYIRKDRCLRYDG